MSVTPNMIAVALGMAAPEPASIKALQWQMWIDDAYMLIEDRRVSFTPARDVDEVKIDYAVREAVVSHVKKPDDATQVTISVDDASTSKTYQSGKGRVSLDSWWSFLGLLEEVSGAYSVDTLGVYVRHVPWCNLMFGASYCSCGADIAGRPIYEGGDW
jgi:hypothetical protein